MVASASFVPDVQDGSTNPLPVPYQEITASGAITIAAGTVVLNAGSVLAVTLVDPPTIMDGAILTIISATAQAHTVSNAAGSGFNGGGTGSDVATFTAAKANGLVLVAVNGEWFVSNNVNGTLA